MKEQDAVFDIYDELQNHSHALRAFGSLLKSSPLAEFADGELEEGLLVQRDVRADNLRWGLQQIVELYLDRQEKILSGYVDQYEKSDTAYIHRAQTILRIIKQGAVTTVEALKKIKEAVALLDEVIGKDGDQKELAEKVREECIRLNARIQKNTR